MLGTVIIDRDSRIRYCNDLATLLLDTHPALVQTPQGFKAHYPEDDLKLQEMLLRLRENPGHDPGHRIRRLVCATRSAAILLP